MTENHIALLSALATHPAPQSGDALASRLGITRARVSQLAKELNADGADLIVSRAGYTMRAPLSMLNADICANGTGFNVNVASIATSTNATLIAAGAPHACAHLTEWQSAGRGRRGRTWAGAPGGSILMSLAWQFSGGAATLSGLSLSVGVAIATALNACGANNVQLKWPNDVLWNGQKLGGVLIELSGDALGPTTAVIGIGLNVSLPTVVRNDIAQAVTDLFHIAPSVQWDRNVVVNALLRELETTLNAFAKNGFPAHADAWRALHAFEGKATRALLPDGTSLQGTHTSVNDAGALLLKTGGAWKTLHSAEVSLRAG